MKTFKKVRGKGNLKTLKRQYLYSCPAKANGNDKIAIEERKLLFGAMLEESRLFDKAIITISAGAYGLSLTMLGTFKQVIFGTLVYLKFAWILLGISIVITLLSFMTSQWACQSNIDIMEHGNLDNKYKNIKLWSTITSILNYTTIFTFIIGLSLLTSFGFLNVYQKEGKAMTDKKVEELEKIPEGFVPPPPPEKSTPKKTPKGPPKEK